MIVAIPLIISVGMMLLARLLYRAPSGNSNVKNPDKPTSLATRGDWIMPLYGIHKRGPLYAWAGDRRSDTTGGGGSGKGGGGDPEPEKTTNYENGFHCVALGIYDYLGVILVNGIREWQGPITAANTPSGTSTTIAGVGTFTIYWGQHDQPINTFMADPDRIGVASRWPHFLTIQWNDMVLSPGSTWPLIEYIIGKLCLPLSLVDSPTESVVGTTTGLNAAHLLLNLLCNEYPDGCGILLSEIDNDTLEAFGVLCVDEGMNVNMDTEANSDHERAIQAILADYGLQMPQVGGRLAFMPIREIVGSVPVLDDDIIMPPNFERDIDRGDVQVQRMVFTYKRRTNFKYRDTDIAFTDNGKASQGGRLNSETVYLETATNSVIASKIGRRRSQENELFAAVTIQSLRASRQLVAGQAFDNESGRYRVVSNKKTDGAPSADLEIVPDIYSVSDVADEYPDPGTSGNLLDVAEDIAFTWVQAAPQLSSELAIVVFRTRAHRQIVGATVWGSVGGASYSNIGSQNYASPGGILTDTIDDDTSALIVSGPEFIDSNGDVASLPDLSGDAAAWQSGALLALINDEIFFVESVSVVAETEWATATAYVLDDIVIPTSKVTGLRYRCTTAGTSGAAEPNWVRTSGSTQADGTVVWTAEFFAWKCNNMIRAQFGSEVGEHLPNDRIYLASRQFLNIIKHPLIADGNNLCVKTVPFTASQTVDISEVDPVCGDIVAPEVILDGGDSET